MPTSRFLAALLLGAATAAAGAGAAAALQSPGRTLIRQGPVRLVALNSSSLAFALSATKRDCDHVELWNTATRGTWRFGSAKPCTNVGSTGSGIAAVGVSQNRVVWLRYTGGNLRDWQLLTATTTRKTPRQLRFIEQDVDLPAPIVIGDSTGAMGIPYAAGNQVVLLGANGAPVLRWTSPSPVVAVTAGRGPSGAVVAALRKTGEVVLLRGDGSVLRSFVFQPDAVKAIALAPAGLVVQVGNAVEIHKGARTTTVDLPANAAMTDYAEGRILYSTKRGDVHAIRVTDHQDTLLLRRTVAGPAVATYDTRGLAWARGRTVNFACGGCVVYGGA